MSVCRNCGGDVDARRTALGYKLCLFCGEEAARQTRHAVVPLHKSNYILVRNPEDLIGINNKGGLVK